MSFYEKVFGWKYHRFGEMDYWLIITGDPSTPGINGGIMKKRDANQPVVNSINVPDIDLAIESLQKNGGIIVVPKTPIPGIGYYAYFTDPEKNIFGVMMDDQSAK